MRTNRPMKEWIINNMEKGVAYNALCFFPDSQHYVLKRNGIEGNVCANRGWQERRSITNSRGDQDQVAYRSINFR